MVRRGVTLIEILVALSVFMVVGGGVMYVLAAQNRSWKLSSDVAEMNLAARLVLDELTRSFRMTGSGLPDFVGGLKVYGSGEEKVVIVMNESGQQDEILGWSRDIPSATLSLRVTDVARFPVKGYVRVDLLVPAPGAPFWNGVSWKTFVLEVKDRADGNGTCYDSLILDASPLQNAPNLWVRNGDITPMSPGGLVQNIDSIRYWKSNDTIYVKRNAQDATPFAFGIDSLRFWYEHPSDGWLDALSPNYPANSVDKVRVRIVFRTKKVDSKLLSRDPSSRGYQFCRMETDLALKNVNLTNK